MPAFAWRDFRTEVESLYAATRAPATAQKMRQALSLLERTGIASTSEISVATIAKVVAELEDVHPNTAAGLLSYLRAALSYAEGAGYIERNPFRTWHRWIQTVPRTSPRLLSPEEIGRVLSDLERGMEDFRTGRLWAWATLLAFTGMRRDEALGLRWTDLLPSERTIRLRPHATRRLKRPTCSRDLPIHPELERVLTEWHLRCPSRDWIVPNRRGTGFWTGGSPGYRPTDRLVAAGLRVGVPGFCPKSLRFSFATHAAKSWGIPELVLMQLLGHTSAETTATYYVAKGAELNAPHMLRIRFA